MQRWYTRLMPRLLAYEEKTCWPKSSQKFLAGFQGPKREDLQCIRRCSKLMDRNHTWRRGDKPAARCLQRVEFILDHSFEPSIVRSAIANHHPSQRTWQLWICGSEHLTPKTREAGTNMYTRKCFEVRVLHVFRALFLLYSLALRTHMSGCLTK